jgi:hypothetical protein
VQFSGELIGQGREATIRALGETPELAAKVTEAVRAAWLGQEDASQN